MCAILDANVVGQVFGEHRPSAGQTFFRWLNSSSGRLVVGGKLLRELDRTWAFREWRKQAVLAGRITVLNGDAVDDRARRLKQRNACDSDDEHVIAVAQLSGARLLYSNDGPLQRDFRDRALIDGPRGRVYSTDPKVSRGQLTRAHRRLLAARGLCAKGAG